MDMVDKILDRDLKSSVIKEDAELSRGGQISMDRVESIKPGVSRAAR